MAFAARRFMVKMRYIGDVGVTSRMIARTSGSRWSARLDFMTYAGDGTRPEVTVGSGAFGAGRRSDVLDDADDAVPLSGCRPQAATACRLDPHRETTLGGRLADDHDGIARSSSIRSK